MFLKSVVKFWNANKFRVKMVEWMMRWNDKIKECLCFLFSRPLPLFQIQRERESLEIRHHKMQLKHHRIFLFGVNCAEIFFPFVVWLKERNANKALVFNFFTVINTERKKRVSAIEFKCADRKKKSLFQQRSKFQPNLPKLHYMEQKAKYKMCYVFAPVLSFILGDSRQHTMMMTS